MSAEPATEPTYRTDGDVLARLTAIDHHLHRISTHLTTTINQLLSQLGEIRTNLERLDNSLESEPVRRVKVTDTQANG